MGSLRVSQAVMEPFLVRLFPVLRERGLNKSYLDSCFPRNRLFVANSVVRNKPSVPVKLPGKPSPEGSKCETRA